MQEVCDIDSQHFFSEKKPDIVQKQDTESRSTESIKQSCWCKSKINLLPTCQSTQTGRGEHSEHFADEFEYDSALQSHE